MKKIRLIPVVTTVVVLTMVIAFITTSCAIPADAPLTSELAQKMANPVGTFTITFNGNHDAVSSHDHEGCVLHGYSDSSGDITVIHCNEGDVITIPREYAYYHTTYYECGELACKSWLDDNGNIYKPGDSYTVTGSVTFTAFYQ